MKKYLFLRDDFHRLPLHFAFKSTIILISSQFKKLNRFEISDLSVIYVTDTIYAYISSVYSKNDLHECYALKKEYLLSA